LNIEHIYVLDTTQKRRDLVKYGDRIVFIKCEKINDLREKVITLIAKKHFMREKVFIPIAKNYI